MSYPIIRRVASTQEADAIVKAAMEDNDMMRLPSHVIIKDGKIAGAYNLANIPLAVGWHSTKLMKSRDSIIALNTVSSIMDDKFPNGYFALSNSKSPMNEYMERFGYLAMWPSDLFYRKL